MKFVILVVILTLGFSVSGLAQSESAPPYEVSVTPLFGYSSYGGFALGAVVGGGVRFARRLQLVSTISYFGYTRSGEGSADFSGGVDYNFSDDLVDSSFVGLGWGRDNGYGDSRDAYVYARYGYRYLISKEHGINWTPTLSFAQTYNEGSRNSNNRTSIVINILRFSILF